MRQVQTLLAPANRAPPVKSIVDCGALTPRSGDPSEWKRRALFDAQDEIDAQRERLIAQIEGTLQQRTSRTELFAPDMKTREVKQQTTRLPSEYGQLLAEIKARVLSAQVAAFRAANKELVAMYWDIGKIIDSRQEAGARGDTVVKKLAEDLQSEFPGVAGFSWRNLFYMSEFYVTYRDLPKLQPLVAIIGWTHNLIILTRCSDPLEREFYIRMTRKFGWSKNVLIHQIENQSYEKTLLNQTNFDKAVTPAIRAQAKLAINRPLIVADAAPVYW